MSSKQLTVNQCQFQTPQPTLHMLIDTNHGHERTSGLSAPSTLKRLRAKIPLVDPEVLAAELLTDINSSPPRRVNLLCHQRMRR